MPKAIFYLLKGDYKSAPSAPTVQYPIELWAGVICGRDSGKENGNYCSILGLYGDIGIMEKKTETSIVHFLGVLRATPAFRS